METQQRSLFFLTSSAALASIFLLSSAFGSPNTMTNGTEFIRTSCGTTQYPEVCFESLSGYAAAVGDNHGQLALLAVSVSLTKAQELYSHLSNLTAAAAAALEKAAATAPSPAPAAAPSPASATAATKAATAQSLGRAAGAPAPAEVDSDSKTESTRAGAALRDCLSTVRDAVDEMRDSMKQMRQAAAAGAGGKSMDAFRFMMSNVQTWMSAALTDEDTCADGFEGVSDAPLKSEAVDAVVEAEKYTSNALALVNQYVNSVRAR